MRNPFRRRRPDMRSHELWQPSSFGDAQFTRRALDAARREIDAQNGWTS